MKHMKKLAGLALAMVMLVALAVPAMAAPTTIHMGLADTNTGHTLTAYQVFKADVKAEGTDETSGSLDDNTLEWGDGVDPVAFVQVLKSVVADQSLFVDIDDDAPDAKAVANILKTLNPDNSEAALTLAKALNDGAALKDGAGRTLPANVESGYYIIMDAIGDKTTAMLQQATRDLKIQVKSGKPTVQKKVWDEKLNGGAGGWSDTAVYAEGDVVQFQLTATIADNYDPATATTYKITFHDSMGAGLTLNNTSIAVAHNATDITSNRNLWTPNLTPAAHEDGKENCTFEVEVDVKGIQTAKAGDTITVTYTATVTDAAAIGGDGNLNSVWLATPEGDTEEDTVKVFTFEFDVNKVDGNDEPLNGAGFTLYKWVADENGEVEYKGEKGSWKVVKVDGPAADGETKTTFKFERLKDGFYKLEESTVPDEYNKADDSYFVIESETSNDPNPALTSLKAHWTDETGTPKTGDLADMTGNITAGSVTTKVVNGQGITLPNTGGIGTTIFYIVGGVLVAAAAILLITKRRMNLNED
ncbi:MAG: isopeptide-forming domain-containing fimbrial protein [Oscillibacter sp.]|nr:isopeptide-forming domain-containing fimbrial protein [Oscillibacter sp.]MCI9375644.1 isopeptide-forming domain-containing fimbrial protein [Oscillibacter sp.]